MKKNAGESSSDFRDFQNIRTSIRVNMFVEKKDIKKDDEDGFEDVREVGFEKDVEFGICDLDENTEISFEFGSIKIDRGKFQEALKKYCERNKYIKKLG